VKREAGEGGKVEKEIERRDHWEMRAEELTKKLKRDKI